MDEQSQRQEKSRIQ